MHNAIVNGIKDLQDKIAELEIDLSVAEEQVIFFKSKAARLPKLEEELKTLRAENLILTQNQEKIYRKL